MMDLLDQDQKKAVTTDSGKVLVCASAGSGKTRVLVNRVRYLIETMKVHPKTIVCITFTNLAANEMKDRLSGVKGINDVFIGTIHSYANKLLKASYNKQYEILTDELESSIYQYVIRNYCKVLTYDDYLKIKKGKPVNRSALDEYNIITYKMPKDTNGKYKDTIMSVKLRRNVITFDQILRLSKANHNEVIISHLLCDEFQDTGNLEYDFLKSLNAKNTFFVGDDWQAIYGFKGSNVDIFMKLYNSKDYKNYTISTNYRSDKSIVYESSEVIKEMNPNDFIYKSVKPNSKNTGEVLRIDHNNAKQVFEKILTIDNCSKWFVLTRSNKDADFITKLLRTINIPTSRISEDNKQEVSDKYNTVKVMTVHAAKGLESDNVVLYGKGFFDSVNPNSKYYNAEERRIMYVGMTRARHKLLILN